MKRFIDNDIVTQFDKFAQIYASLDKFPRNYGVNVPIYTSEMLLLEYINNYPEKNLSELADIMGKSRMAISSLSRKLEEKGLIQFKETANKRIKIPVLTETGKSAIQNHLQYHIEHDNEFRQYRSNYTDEEIQIIMKFINEYIDYLKSYVSNPNRL